jgi:hypothetical protein
MIPQFQFLILAYERQQESQILLDSIARRVKIPRENYWVTYLDNGSQDHDKVLEWYKSGLIDQVVLRRKNTGGSWGMVDLANLCQSEYAFLVQNDQFLIEDINEMIIDGLILGLGSSKIVDVAGFQAGAGKFSDRASFVRVSDYKEWTKNLENYGPGYEGNHEDKELNDHNEGKVQKLFEKNNWKVCGTSHILFGNNGKWSVRKNRDGSIWKHSTDEKRQFLLSGPVKEKSSYPRFNEEEWNYVLTNQSWPDGQIPEGEKQHSFLYWKE